MQIVTVRVNLKTESMGIDAGEEHYVVNEIDSLDAADTALAIRSWVRREDWHEEYPAEYITAASEAGRTDDESPGIDWSRR